MNTRNSNWSSRSSSSCSPSPAALYWATGEPMVSDVIGGYPYGIRFDTFPLQMQSKLNTIRDKHADRSRVVITERISTRCFRSKHWQIFLERRASFVQLHMFSFWHDLYLWLSMWSVCVYSSGVFFLLLSFRALDALFNFLLVWYYCTLTIRESILISNGSRSGRAFCLFVCLTTLSTLLDSAKARCPCCVLRIKGWWVFHHYVSTFLSGVMLTWWVTWCCFHVSGGGDACNQYAVIR